MTTSGIIKRGQIVELNIESLAYGGMGLAKIDNFVIFVKGAIPGQKVLAKIYKKKSGYAEAKPTQLINESPHAIKPKCDHYWICSRIQNLSYEEQLNEKACQVKSVFSKIGGFTDFKLDYIIGANNIYNYRNKMEFTFSPNRWVLSDEPEGVDRTFALGLHIPGRYDKILDVDNCFLQPEIGTIVSPFP